MLLHLCFGTSRAHDPGISTADATVTGQRVKIVTGFAPADANEFLPDALRLEGSWSDTEFSRVSPRLEEMAPELWHVEVGGERQQAASAAVQLLPGDNVSFEVSFSIGERRGTVVLRAPKLGQLPEGHRQFVIVYDEKGLALTRKLLSARDQEIVVPDGGGEGDVASPVAEDSTTGSATFWSFLRLGVEHIWTGYDHLLFLFALLVVCRTFKAIVAIISCFTIAHSITLGLATLGVYSPPAVIVEPLIAASIVFVWVENLLRAGEEPPRRWLLTFVFGLVHGFGFAGVLRDLGVGRSESSAIAMPLFSFNLGVELGQIVIAAVVLPLIWRFRKKPGFVRRGVPILSTVVALAGVYWLLERTLL